jgi:hypothetical protein
MARYSKARREEGTASIARVYAEVNEKRPAEYWDYESLNVQARQRRMDSPSRRGWPLLQAQMEPLVPPPSLTPPAHFAPRNAVG